jgi:hypothetical protein
MSSTPSRWLFEAKTIQKRKRRQQWRLFFYMRTMAGFNPAIQGGR